MSFSLVGLAWHSGEALPVTEVVVIQQSQPQVIYGTSKIENIMPMKLETYRVRQPDILILGSSRLLQVRDQFFTRQPEKVYNASGGGWQLGAMIQYYEQLPAEHRPKIMILGIDQIWFNADANAVLEVAQDINTTDQFSTLQRASVNIMRALLGGDVSLPELISHTDGIYHQTALGLTAIDKSFGYRADGSLRQGELIASWMTSMIGLDIQISGFPTSTAYNFAPGNQVRMEALDRLDEFLEQLEADNVTVIGITVPYHFQIYDQMITSGRYTYMEKAYPLITDLFESHGFYYHVFDDIRPFFVEYNEWYDGWHVTESGSLRMLKSIFESHPDIFDLYTDIAEVQNLLESFTNPMDVLRELPE